MKCIKDNKSGEVRRVEDQKAYYLVDAKTHSFVAKKEWKKIPVEKKTSEVVEKKTKKNKSSNSKKGKARKEVVESPEVVG